MTHDPTQSSISTADRILYAAMQIISEAGLKGLSASKLASAVNISKSTVFHYYKKMDDIPAFILEKLYSEIINPIQEDHYDSVRSYLKALGTSSFSSNEQHIVIFKAFLSLFQASMYDANLQHIVSRCSDQFDSMLYGKLRSLCNERIDDDTLKTLTHLIYMSLDGICLHYLIHSSQAQAQMAWELLIDALVDQYGLVEEDLE